jgi:hypothetical protein
MNLAEQSCRSGVVAANAGGNRGEDAAPTEANVTVRMLQANDLARWDAYVHLHPRPSFTAPAGSG